MTVNTVLSLADFSEIESHEKAILKVSTSTCAPCKMMNPLYDLVAAENEDVVFYSITADEAPADIKEYAEQVLGVRTVPTFFVYENGKITSQFGGAVPKSQFIKKLGLEA